MYALGYTFLEVIFSSLSTEESSTRTSQQAFKRLLEEVFELDLAKLREYCAEEGDWADAVGFLDERSGAGWDLLGDMLRALDDQQRLGLPSAHKLAQHIFL
mmetsp:Transcript_22516/g.55014  ORF Transcript_22516/g.55014 Transcript_22516/m.55014 type:complete len:101 (-) Transcript_22516:32-334(-)